MPKATIPIYHDDDFERLAELRLEVAIAGRAVEQAIKAVAEAPRLAARAGDDDPGETVSVAVARAALKSAENAYDAFVDEAAERAEMWALKPIGHEEFRDLLLAHPPRTVMVKVKVKAPTEDDPEREVERGVEQPHPDDEGWEFNTETFSKALLLFVDPDDDEVRTIVEPKFDTDVAMRKRVKRLSKGEFASMWVTAYQANEGGIRDPKLSRFSSAAPRSDET